MIYVYANQKGGTGKSTSVINMAHALHLEGYKVCIIDTDNQGTVSSFDSNRRMLLASDLCEGMDLSYPVVQSIDSKSPYRAFIEKIRDRFDYILIDTKGEFNQFQFDLIRLADCVICPIAPSAFDLNPTILVHEAVEHENSQRASSSTKLKMAYTISMADGTNTQKHIVSKLEKLTGRKIIEPYTRKSDSVRALCGVGITPMDAMTNVSRANRIINAERDEETTVHLDKSTIDKIAGEMRSAAEFLRGI